MGAIKNLLGIIDGFTELTGRLLAWLLVLLVINMFLVVLLRYGFDYGSTALQELSTYLHASAFMLGAAYTLRHNGHVRVDIFYQRYTARRRAWVDCIGVIVFLLPFCGYLLFYSVEFFLSSLAMREGSSEPGGLPALYLLKALIPLAAILLALQALAEFARSLRELLATTDKAQ